MSSVRSGGLSIGLVCPYSLDQPGGVQNHVLGLARFLVSQGHRPQVLAPGRRGADTVLNADLDLTSAGRTVALPYNGSVARVSFGPVSAARVRNWLQAGGFDLVHLHEPITPSISLAALRQARGPVVATFHTATPRSRTMQVAGTVLRGAIDRIDAGIAVSEAARDVVVQHLGRGPKIIPNGFTYADFAAPLGDRGTPGRAARQPRLMFLGRTDEPRKGLDVLVAAAPAIAARFPQLRFAVAGEGQRALPPGWQSLGVVTDRAKAELLSGTDVFVAPHRSRESFGIVLLEAMASGAAVVASDLAPFVDLLRGPALGEIFAAGDAAALARAVIATLDQPDRVRTLAAQDAARRYDWSVVGPQVVQVYRRVLGGSALDPEPRSARPLKVVS